MASSPEERILRSLRRIGRAIELQSKKLRSTHALTTPQLICLREMATMESATPTALARAVTLSQPTITGILDRLVHKGLVRRERSKVDRRRVDLTLTEAGRAAVRDAPPPLHARFSERLASQSAREQRRIEEVLEQIVEMLEAQDLDAAPMLVTGAIATADDALAGSDSSATKAAGLPAAATRPRKKPARKKKP